MTTLVSTEPDGDRASSPAHVPSAVRRSTTPGCSKLRDSCQACAASKVKCTKEKPSCARCEARSIECQYLFAKRPGRRRENSGGPSLRCTSKIIITKPSSNSNSPISTTRSNTERESQSDRSRFREPVEVAGLSPVSVLSPNGPATPVMLPATDALVNTPQDLAHGAPLMQDDGPGTYPSDVFSVLDDSNIFSQLPDLDIDFNDMDFRTGNLETPAMDSDSITDTLNDISSLLMPDSNNRRSLGSSDVNDPINSIVSSGVPSLSPDVQTLSSARSSTRRATITSSPCDCLTQALDLLKTLCATHSSSTPALGGSDTALVFLPNTAAATANANTNTDTGVAQTILEENKQHIEAVSVMLSCSSCTADAFLLTLFSMIVLKILERYATAARSRVYKSLAGGVESNKIMQSSGKNMHMPALSRTHTHKYNGMQMAAEDSMNGRVPARLVLSELHRVQRLVKHLSPHLKETRERERETETDDRAMTIEHTFQGRARGAEENKNSKTIAPQFSSATLTQMESDLRRNLSLLSADIIIQLRQN
ncbi:C6 zinc finger domain protein [Aspergillus ustus]|uniref:C6 zinc finger domain protein n=1 Tax=Aspergillus ustus TaxID=40382 RepID=A0A0C1E196_ASPUT|nr:C6 zinc finger domain protein [Aspergillus ustus]